jgi:sugar/nucleoside kinase (ribokinase family)
MDRALDVVHLGSASRDLTDDDPRGWRLGGGVTYAALTTARLGLATGAAIGVDGPASMAWELDLLRDAGVEVLPIEVPEGPVFTNEERPGGRVQVAHAVGVRLPHAALPDRWQTARAWAIVPVADELPRGLVGRVPDGALVALGWQGLLRTLRPGARVERRDPRPEEVLARAELVGLSRNDVGPDITLPALTALLRDGARLAITNGAEGGALVVVSDGQPGKRLEYPPVSAGPEVDATGAGDTFLAALLSVILGEDLAGDVWPTEAQLRFAAAAAAIAVGGAGLAGVPADVGAVRRVAATAGPVVD